MRCAVRDLAAASDGKCVLCRREQEPPPPAGGVRTLVIDGAVLSGFSEQHVAQTIARATERRSNEMREPGARARGALRFHS